MNPQTTKTPTNRRTSKALRREIRLLKTALAAIEARLLHRHAHARRGSK